MEEADMADKRRRYRVIAHFKNGLLLKGYTQNFRPPIRTFVIVSEHDADDISEISMTDLKALFFVKTFEGENGYIEKNKFEVVDTSSLKGLKVKIVFSDGEIIRGMTPNYRNIFTGFYIKPLDPKCNNNFVYILADSPRNIAIGALAET